MSEVIYIDDDECAHQASSEDVTRSSKRKAGSAEEVVDPRTPPVTDRADQGAAATSPPRSKASKRQPSILFTGIVCPEEEEIVKQLGGSLAPSPERCTHLVTDKFRRTVKTMCCIAKGTPIVDIAWIEKCEEAKTFVDHSPFLLKDRGAEKHFKFRLDETLRRAAPSSEIVSCAGATYLAEMPTRCNGWPTIIVSCKEDLKSCMESTERHVPIVSAEFVLSGLLQYKVDFGAHTLD
ncbi:mediator of DNA damage checkpoint protein 1-like [Haemaphysalis longicornis]